MKTSSILIAVILAIAGMSIGHAEKKVQTFRVTNNYVNRPEFPDFEVKQLECTYGQDGKLEKILSREELRMNGSPAVDGTTPPQKYDTVLYLLHWKPGVLEVSKRAICNYYPDQEQSDTAWVFTLNDKGNVEMMVCGGKVTRFTYNGEGELTEFQKSFGTPEADRFNLFYDQGNLVTATDSSDRMSFTYHYTDITNLAGINLQLQDLLGRPNRNPVLLLAGITGRPPARLYSSTTRKNGTEDAGTKICDLRYELDKDGYVTKISGYTGDYKEQLSVEISYTGTGSVHGIQRDEENLVKVNGRSVTTSDGSPLYVCNLQGSRVAYSPTGNIELTHSGIYLVNCGENAYKILVR